MQVKKHHATLYLLMAILTIACSEPIVRQDISIVPRPNQLTEHESILMINSDLRIYYSDESLAVMAANLADQMSAITGIKLSSQRIEVTSIDGIILNPDPEIKGEEAYKLSVNDGRAELSGSTERGIFYAGQSLIQLIQSSNGQYFIPGVKISDQPRFGWRGMHLDVSRHFFDVDKIKKYIDYLSLYKLNTFHWHLTDDQGWRIEIKKYPLLTDQGAWRASVGFASNQAKGLNMDDGQPYGGFYTQDEIREVVAYAQERQVTVVPEIEMPGHTSAVLKAYPQLACEGIDKAELWAEGGVSNHVFCAGKEETFDFLQNVLEEVLVLFPSQYIHAGGDEAPKIHWQQCGLCQKRINQEGLADEHELQSYFITRMEKYLNDKGRKLIGWDEILEGGLAPNATVMSWRGEAGGIAAAQSQHDAVMTPGFPLYFNHRPIDLKNTPGHSSSNNTLTTVYQYDPVPKELKADERKYIIGVQANLWTEYIPKWEHVESLVFPRLLSLAEIAWTNQERKDFADFRKRLPAQLDRLSALEVNYGRDPYQVMISMQMTDGLQKVSMTTELPGLEIRYTTNGSEPDANSNLYNQAFACTQSSTIKAAAFEASERVSETSQIEYLHHKATGKLVNYNKKYSPKYNAGGDLGLVDGLFGFEETIANGWQGFLGKEVIITIDLGEEIQINSISAGFLTDQNQWIFQPDQVVFEISTDSTSFQEVYNERFSASRVQAVVQTTTRPAVSEIEGQARYVRMKVFNDQAIPDWHGGAGTMPWIFIDEIVVD